MKRCVVWTAWIWRGEPGPGVERRESRFSSLIAARVALCAWVSDWPEATEYGIDHEDDASWEGPVADFLSDAIIERTKDQE